MLPKKWVSLPRRVLPQDFAATATNCVWHVTGKQRRCWWRERKAARNIVFAPKIAKQFEKMSRNLKMSRRIWNAKEATACDTPTICPSDMNIVAENQCRDNILWESLREGVGRCGKGEVGVYCVAKKSR